ncbi:MAG: NOB1 family endonuclease [Promethearchaeota archaeon]
MQPQRPTIFIIDTSALYHQQQFAAEDIQLATTPLVEKEMHHKGLKESLDLLIVTNKLRIIEPTSHSIKKVKTTAQKLGDLPTLSEPDQELLALAVDLTTQDYRVILVTDDYAIQNVAQQLGVEFKSVSTSGIREIINWETYCKACGHKEPGSTTETTCPVCGTALKRRAIRKQHIE